VLALCVLNQKGGTAKTTTAVHLAARYAADGVRTVLLDLDPQGHAARCLGVDSAMPSATARLLREEASLADLVVEARAGLDLVASAGDVAQVAAALPPADGVYRLADEADAFRGYGAVVIDCPPELGVLTLAASALVADLVSGGARGGLVVPVTPEPLAVVGLSDLLKTQRRLEPRGVMPPVFAVVPTRVDSRNRVTREVADALEATFPGRVSPGVRTTVRLAEAPNAGQTIYEYDPGGRGAEDYSSVARFLEDLAQTNHAEA
jgi:chromosome partitioning protein